MIKVEYIDHMGDDKTVVRAARVSFSNENKIFEEGKDDKLIKFLAKHNHITPFFHPQITLRITAPIFIARQLFRHKIGLAENEISRRYVNSTPEIFVPDYWRPKNPDKKQGSINTKHEKNDHINEKVKLFNTIALTLYEDLLQEGVCPEQARMVLPQSMMTSWYLTGSLAAFSRIYNLRAQPDAQLEIQQLADKMYDIIQPLYPISWEALVGEKHNLHISAGTFDRI